MDEKAKPNLSLCQEAAKLRSSPHKCSQKATGNCFDKTTACSCFYLQNSKVVPFEQQVPHMFPTNFITY